MTWQDWSVAVIGVALAVWLVVRVARRVSGKSKKSPCCGCGCADSCPSAQKVDKCDSKKQE